MKKSPKQSPPPPQGNRRNIPPDATSPSFCRGSGLILIRARYARASSCYLALAALVSCADAPMQPAAVEPAAVEPAAKMSNYAQVDDSDVRWFLLEERSQIVGIPPSTGWKMCKGGDNDKIYNGETIGLGDCGKHGNIDILPITIIARVKVQKYTNNFTLTWDHSGGGSLVDRLQHQNKRPVTVKGDRARNLKKDPFVRPRKPFWFTSEGWTVFALCGSGADPVGYGKEGTPDELITWGDWFAFLENKPQGQPAYLNCARNGREKLRGKSFTGSIRFRPSDHPDDRDDWVELGGISLTINP